MNSSETRFLNVDFDLRGTPGVRDLVRVLEPSRVVLRLTGTEATLEQRDPPRTQDKGLRWIAQLVEDLPADARKHWDACDVRTTNVGIQAGDKPHEALFPVPINTVTALLGIKAELLFTICANARD
ncbi:hypothetical protein HMI49_32610 [Corallococcus exercitus]|uniref:DUF4279 domain-containing protein n=1 Tax=Corallococcus exercitus TaxID=2316736 RepID=A0A7Y4KS52_9BACT|nr:hypothetical protein [Corallococcus exercitus]NOK37954.1 hypothetical protein [Corallococcus exercitus]